MHVVGSSASIRPGHESAYGAQLPKELQTSQSSMVVFFGQSGSGAPQPQSHLPLSYAKLVQYQSLGGIGCDTEPPLPDTPDAPELPPALALPAPPEAAPPKFAKPPNGLEPLDPPWLDCPAVPPVPAPPPLSFAPASGAPASVSPEPPPALLLPEHAALQTKADNKAARQILRNNIVHRVPVYRTRSHLAARKAYSSSEFALHHALPEAAAARCLRLRFATRRVSASIHGTSEFCSTAAAQCCSSCIMMSALGVVAGANLHCISA